METPCCKAGPGVTSNYQPKGTKTLVGYTDVYFSGSGASSIIIIYDIFGFSPQAMQVCDILADAGFNVAMPDIFRGNPWKLEEYPPKDGNEFMEWLSKSSFDEVVSPDIQVLQTYMKANKGVESFGLVGFCWGGSMAVRACSKNLFKAGAIVHYAFVTPELLEGVNVPLCILPSGDEADHNPLKEVLDKKPFGKDCFYKRFDDMTHGFCAARGDWTQPLQAQRANEAVNLLAEFMKKHVTSA